MRGVYLSMMMRRRGLSGLYFLYFGAAQSSMQHTNSNPLYFDYMSEEVSNYSLFEKVS